MKGFDYLFFNFVKSLISLFMQLVLFFTCLITPTEQPDSPGILRRLAERARQAKAKFQGLGETALGFASAYYEDHIQPVTDSYVEWASNVRSSLQEGIQTAVENYMPFRN
uniref:Apolipoprotein C-IV n=1 Tax=Oryzias latipes TaxID=8090 RepID=A0A3P9HAA8_ORYLA